MRIDEFISLAGSINRADAIHFFHVSHEYLAERVRDGELKLLRDALTPFGDHYALVDPDSVRPLDLRGRTVDVGRSKTTYVIGLDVEKPGMWKLSADGHRLRHMSTYQLVRILGLKSDRSDDQ